MYGKAYEGCIIRTVNISSTVELCAKFIDLRLLLKGQVSQMSYPPSVFTHNCIGNVTQVLDRDLLIPNFESATKKSDNHPKAAREHTVIVNLRETTLCNEMERWSGVLAGESLRVRVT